MTEELDNLVWKAVIAGIAYRESHPQMKPILEWSDSEEEIFRKQFLKALKEWKP